MKVIRTAIEDVLIIEPQVFGDDRGFFLESYNAERWQKETGLTKPFVQDNHSRSVKGVLRGIHYQIQQPQGKLVRVVSGEVFDVAVDLRKSSLTFGKSVSVLLTAENKKQLWIPEGFGHGFLVVSDNADFLYKTTEYYSPENERCIIWNDAELNIDWPENIEPQLSAKDEKGIRFADADVFK